MVKLKGGEVNIGDAIIWESEGKRFLGKFESLYGSKMNVRLNSNNELHTVAFTEVSRASPEVLEAYQKNKGKNELVKEVEVLAEKLKPLGVEVSIRNA